MNKRMKISIITTCFNRKGTIRNAIESVLAQDYPGIEYIVVDGPMEQIKAKSVIRKVLLFVVIVG